MAYYQIGKVIKMRRTALGYGQNDFEDFGTTGMTVYRIENGKSGGTERTYRKLTKAMGTEESIRQGILKTSHMDILRLVNDITETLNKKDYAKVEELLSRIESGTETDTPRNRQYIEWIRAKLKYEQRLIGIKEYESVIRTALAYTIPKFEGISLREWPFHQIEIHILIDLSNVLRRQKRHVERRKLLKDINAALDMDYISSEQKSIYRTIMLLHLADVLGNMGEHRAAIEVDKENLCLCRDYREFRALYLIYYDIYWNYYELGKQKTLSIEEETECRQYLLKAYYFSEAQGIHKELYEKCIREQYPEELQ